MGYQITSGGAAGENLTDAEWLDVLYLASEHGFSAPHLRLERGEDAAIADADAAELYASLGRALDPGDVPYIAGPGDKLDRDTAGRVRRVLRSRGAKKLRRVPPWKAACS